MKTNWFGLRDWMLQRTGAYSVWRPKDDKLKGLMWVWSDEEGWYEVCDFCHGNCGQCGITGRVGNRPYSLDAIVKNGHWDKGTHAGLNSPGNRVRLKGLIDDLDSKL